MRRRWPALQHMHSSLLSLVTRLAAKTARHCKPQVTRNAGPARPLQRGLDARPPLSWRSRRW